MNLSAMQSQNHPSEIETLELQLAEKQILLETFVNANALFQKSKEIQQEIKEIKDRLQELKNGNKRLK
jgi:hypothetical protein